MKYIFNILLILTYYNTYSQKHEVSLSYKYGISTRNMKAPKPNLQLIDTYNLQTINDISFHSKYSYNILPKFLLSLTFGLEFSKINYYKPMFTYSFNRIGKHIENELINSNRINIHLLGVNKKFNFYDDKLSLELGFSLVKRLYLNKNQNYHYQIKTHELMNFETENYEHKMNIFVDKFHENNSKIKSTDIKLVNTNFSILLKSNFYKNYCFFLGFEYSRNNILFYDYNLQMDFYYTHNKIDDFGEPYQEIIFYEESYSNETDFGNNLKLGVRDHFLYLNFGISYKF